MPDDVRIREDLQIIQVDSHGDVTAENLKRSLEEVVRIHQKRGLSKVLVDATKQRSLPDTVPVFQFGSELAEASRKLKFAIVSSRKTVAAQKFLETAAVNRGACVQVFDSVDAALAWLLGKPNKPDAG